MIWGCIVIMENKMEATIVYWDLGYDMGLYNDNGK